MLLACVELMAPTIGCVSQALLSRVQRQAIDNGVRGGMTTAEAQRMKALEREALMPPDCNGCRWTVLDAQAQKNPLS